MSNLSTPQTDAIGQPVSGANPNDFLVVGPTNLLSVLAGNKVNKTVFYSTSTYSLVNNDTSIDVIAQIVSAGAVGSQSVVGSTNAAGRKYRVTIYGVYSVAGAGATLTITPGWGASLFTTSTNVLTAVSKAPYKLEIIFDFLSINATTGSIRTSSYGDIGHTLANSAINVDTTATNSLLINMQWSVADPVNNIVIDQMYIETIG